MKSRSNTTQIVRMATAIGLLLTAVLLAACASNPTPATKAEAEAKEPGTPAAAATPPTIKLVEPTAGAEVAAGSVKVAVETTGLKFVMPSNTNVPGEGHVHFTLDSRPFEMSIEPQSEIKDVAAGPHNLVAELVQNNTESFDPPIRQEIEFVAK